MELENRPPVSTCWWDTWRGWVCHTDHSHVWETDFTWNAGVGIRWDINDRLFIKASVGAQWLEYSGAKGITTQMEGIFAIGWRY